MLSIVLIFLLGACVGACVTAWCRRACVPVWNARWCQRQCRCVSYASQPDSAAGYFTQRRRTVYCQRQCGLQEGHEAMLALHGILCNCMKAHVFGNFAEADLPATTAAAPAPATAASAAATAASVPYPAAAVSMPAASSASATAPADWQPPQGWSDGYSSATSLDEYYNNVDDRASSSRAKYHKCQCPGICYCLR
jgi:hypothetical protein